MPILKMLAARTSYRLNKRSKTIAKLGFLITALRIGFLDNRRNVTKLQSGTLAKPMVKFQNWKPEKARQLEITRLEEKVQRITRYTGASSNP